MKLSSLLRLPCVGSASLVAALIAALTTPAHAGPVFTFGAITDGRVVTEPSGARDDNNGGNTISGALIGLNTGGVDNFMMWDFPSLGSLAGQQVASATVNVYVATNFQNGNHGTTDDLINLHEIALGNAGFVTGTSTIGGSDNPATNGSVSFLHQAEFNSASSVPWVDASGTDVADLTGAFLPVDTISGWNQLSAPQPAVFDVPVAIAQSWIDNGLAGLALSTTDNGDSRSRYNFQARTGSNIGAEIIIELVPEPSSMVLVFAAAGMLGAFRKR